MTTLNLQAKQDFLERDAATRDPIRAIAELVWNALDADATRIEVVLERNDLGGLNAIRVVDNGSGISAASAEHDFGNLGDSWKRDARRTGLGRAIHGKEGRGRLRFYSLAQRARWFTTTRSDAGLSSRTLEIHAKSLERCEVVEADSPTAEDTGTIVLLTMLKDTFDVLSTPDAYRQFSTLFAPYVLQYPNAEIWFNGFKVDPDVTIHRWQDLPPMVVQLPDRTIDDLKVKVIEWKSANETRQIHFGGEDGIVLGSQPAHVTAPGFEFSAYAYSAFFQEIADKNLLELDNLGEPNFLAVVGQIREALGDYFRGRMSEQSLGVIQDLKDQGAYPYDGEPRDEIERRERQVFDIATYAINSHSRDFSRAETPLKRMTLTLLKEAIKHNPDDISTILQAVVNLGKAKQSEFSALLKKTQLGNIIGASSLVSDRITTLEVLKGMVFDAKFRRTVKERGELDALVRDNTWLFGEQFHITMAESGLTKVMNRVAEDLGNKRRGGRKVTKLDGTSGRVDCFLGRSVPHPDAGKREYLLIELKRPLLTLGRKELDQVEDYVNAIRQEAEFTHTDTSWSFFLVASEFDPAIHSRIYQKDRPHGLFLHGDNFMFWIKTWAEVVRENEARLRFVQQKLQVEVSDEEIEQRIADLRQLVVK
ncbi:MAG: ATP-binding protein [Sphingomonas sp.]|uniref:ATP-binding protein n=1 Tax=Sphingomonas sp. TaxID=28214 RepID=UPI001B0CE376|nr:ATP-binding protein [Sphingomonas sp.]MBO9621681.1 ATP-binding protein [Sphingomonas sp.]